MAKQIKTVETTDGVTVITYDDGSQEVQHGGSVIQADTVEGSIVFRP